MAIYACSDLHGRLDLLEQIQSFLNHDDKVYFLGDAGDRGSYPWESIKRIAQDNRFIYLKGNHEDMLVQAMGDEVRNEGHGVLGKNFALLSQNGGGETFLHWLLEPMKTGWWSYLKKLPTYEKYVNEQGSRFIFATLVLIQCRMALSLMTMICFGIDAIGTLRNLFLMIKKSACMVILLFHIY